MNAHTKTRALVTIMHALRHTTDHSAATAIRGLVPWIVHPSQNLATLDWIDIDPEAVNEKPVRPS